jgi:hypothetical protein
MFLLTLEMLFFVGRPYNAHCTSVKTRVAGTFIYPTLPDISSPVLVIGVLVRFLFSPALPFLKAGHPHSRLSPFNFQRSSISIYPAVFPSRWMITSSSKTLVFLPWE